MEDRQERIMRERADLSTKLTDLSSFIQGPVFVALEKEDQSLLREQRAAMIKYWAILASRIRRFA